MNIGRCGWIGGALSAALSLTLALPVAAAPVWQQVDTVQSQLDNNWTYAGDPVTRTAVTTFVDQLATNTGAASAHLGFYVAWTWSYDATGADTPLAWDNAQQAFVASGIKMTVERSDAATQSLTIGDVLGDTWIGVPWAPGSETPIASQADWVAPLFDLGEIGAGASTTYAMRVTLTFDDQAAFDDWNRAGSFYIGAQGVQRVDVPEPGGLALAALAGALAAGASRRARRARSGL